MTDEQLILKWNELKNRIYDHDKVEESEIETFSNTAHESYIAGDITQQQFLKYAEIVCYLKDIEVSRDEYEKNMENI